MVDFWVGGDCMDCDHNGELEIKTGQTYCTLCGQDVTNHCVACKKTDYPIPGAEPCETCMIGG